MSQTSASLISLYQKTTPSTRNILQILSVVSQPINLTTLKELLSTLAKYDHLTVQINSTWRDLLVKNHLIQFENNDFRCHPNIIETATRDLLKGGDFTLVLQAARLVIPVEKQAIRHHGILTEAQMHALRIEAYSEKFEVLQKRLGIIGYECYQEKN